MKLSLLKDLGQLIGACNHPVLADPNVIMDQNGQFILPEELGPKDHSTGVETIIHHIDIDTSLESSKIEQLVGMIQPGSVVVAGASKVVVFLCWTRYLDL